MDQALQAVGFLAGAVVYGGFVLVMSGRKARKDRGDDIDSKLGAESSSGMRITAGAMVEGEAEAMAVGPRSWGEERPASASWWAW
mgnify:CR=1 FL=1